MGWREVTDITERVFNEDWLKPGSMVPVDASTTAILLTEIARLRMVALGKTREIRKVLDACEI